MKIGISAWIQIAKVLGDVFMIAMMMLMTDVMIMVIVEWHHHELVVFFSSQLPRVQLPRIWSATRISKFCLLLHNLVHQSSTFIKINQILQIYFTDSSLPTVAPSVDLSTSQQPAVVKAGEDYYYYYYYYDEEEGANPAAAGSDA